jgi:electron transfer flavoprotein alpha subunit
MVALVIAEHDNVALKPATLHAVTAARACASEVHILVAGEDCAGVAAQAAAVDGVTRVLRADAPQLREGLPETLAAQILALARDYSHIVAPATSGGKSTLPRVAARLDVAQVSEVTAVLAPDTFERPIYAGNAVAAVRSRDPIKVLTVRTTGFDAAATNGAMADIVALPAVADAGKSHLLSRTLSTSDRPELAAAKIVVSGGRGLGNGDNFRTVLEPLADRLGAALGASRAAVDAGFVPNDLQVGQTGKVVAPQLYIAVGISGAIQHLAGMKDSRVIVAINKDPEAPIFQVADYGLVGDLFDQVPQLVSLLGGEAHAG